MLRMNIQRSNVEYHILIYPETPYAYSIYTSIRTNYDVQTQDINKVIYVAPPYMSLILGVNGRLQKHESDIYSLLDY